MRHRLAIVTASLFWLALAGSAPARVFFSKDEALKAAFPAGQAVEAKDLFLTTEQVDTVQKACGSKLDSPLVTVYEARAAGKLDGLAVFDTQIVKTQPETLLVVLSPEGRVAATLMCSFQEPEEYLPTARWFEQFKGKAAGADLRVGGDIAGVVGSTLSSRSIAAAVRRALALHGVWRSGAH
ncbi:MAG: FMN-binding protein [Candidatus Wallbacteria bacterium]|nr:FMN-binding protein [Candidatus Wallbacteria bacterium]